MFDETSLHMCMSDIKTKGNTILQHLFMNMLALHISIKLNWKVLSWFVRGSSMFQSLESKVVSASSTLKVSKVCSWQHYFYQCRTVLEIKPSCVDIQMNAIQQLRAWPFWKLLLYMVQSEDCTRLFYMYVTSRSVVGTPVCVTIDTNVKECYWEVDDSEENAILFEVTWQSKL